jgi:hypothetical protein
MMECFWAIIIKFESFQLQPSLSFPSISVIAFDRIRTHGHWTWTHRLKTSSSFTVREVSPAFRFAKPLSTVLTYQARRGGGTTIPYHDSLLGRSLASPKVVVRSLRRSRDAPH